MILREFLLTHRVVSQRVSCFPLLNPKGKEDSLVLAVLLVTLDYSDFLALCLSHLLIHKHPQSLALCSSGIAVIASLVSAGFEPVGWF